jgi:hypothetical protein
MSLSQVLVAHICNPSYTGGRDQEDHGSKPVWANSLQNLSQKTLHRGWGQWGEMTQALYAHMNNKTIKKKNTY